MFISSIKEINRLLSTGMSNKSLHCEKVTYSKLRFSKFYEFLDFLLQLKNLEKKLKKKAWKKICTWLFYYFYFGRTYGVLKSKSPSHVFCWRKIWTLIKTRWNRKWKIPHTVFERWNRSFSSYKNCESKVKLYWVGACARKKSAFFVMFILFKGNVFKICVLSHCMVYWMNFENIYTFAYQKTLLSYSFAACL